MLDGLAEVVKRGEPDAVDGAVAVLAEVDLVEIRLEDLVLLVVDLQQHRHHQLGDLALERALRAEEEVLHQLLREGAPALEPPQADEVQRGPSDAAKVEAVVGDESALL